MDTAKITTVLFPIVLGILMFGLGLSLTAQDFLNIKKSPKPVVAGLLIQMIICPLFAYFLIRYFDFTPILSIGFMLLASSPGGPSANVFSLLAKGDVALNITLTAINTLLGALFIPLMVYLSYSYYLGAEFKLFVPVAKIMQTILLILIPIFLGMLARKQSVEFAQKSDPWVRKFAVLSIALLALLGLSKSILY